MKMILVAFMFTAVSAFAQTNADAASGAELGSGADSSVKGSTQSRDKMEKMRDANSNNAGGSAESYEHRQNMNKKKSGWRNKKRKDSSSR